jgi:hypothetical protein
MITQEAQKYIDRLAELNLDEPHFNRAKVEEHIRRHYELLDVTCPEIVVADNMVAGYELARDAARDAAWDAARDAARGAAWGAARGAAWGAAWDAARDAAWDAARDAACGAAWGAARGAAWGAAWDAARGAARGAARDAAWDAARGAARGAAWGAARGAAWGAARGIGALNTGLKDEATLKYVEIDMEIFKALENGLGFFFPMKDKLVLVPTPRMIIAGDRLHYDQGKAVEWPDGTGFYFLQGVKFEEDLYKKVVSQEISAEEVMKIPNAETRMAAISMLKPKELLKQLGAKLTHTGQKGTKLYEVKNFMDMGETEYAMHMVCPSTAREYVEWVEPEVGKRKDADLAQAHAFGIPLEDYLAMEQEA